MNNEFIITKIVNVILISKEEYPSNNLGSNELIYHFSGESIVRFNGKTLKTTPNTIRFLPKGPNKEYTVEKKEYGESIDVFFDTDPIISHDAFLVNIKNNAYVKILFKKLFSIWVSRNNGYYFECVSLLYKIFAEIQKNNYIPARQYEQIKPAIEYIEENFLKERIPIASLSKKCSISESYLKKLFIKKFGTTPSKYIIRLKINHACDLLQFGQYNITQISKLCGYPDVYHFSHQFKEYMGCSPTKFMDKYNSSK